MSNVAQRAADVADIFRQKVVPVLKAALGLVLAVPAGWLAYKFPDMDQTVSIPGLLVHRSAITHSALVVLAMSILSARLGWRAVRPALTSDFFEEPLACLAHEPR